MYVRILFTAIIIIVSFTITEAQEGTKVIMFYGNSLTAGMGLDPELAFPNLIQNKINKTHKDYLVVNAGLSGETSAGGLTRIDWVLQRKIDIFVLELGANDGLRGLPLESTRQNLQDIIEKVRQKYPEVKILLAGMMVPPNMGADYTSEFMKIYPELAKINKAGLIPFLLDGVAGNPDLNLPDGIHPNADGHQIVSDNVWKVLKTML
jgi:acyl-CoA thioesterase I